MNKIWDKIQKNLENRLKPGIFQVWIKPLQGQLQDKSLILLAPNEFVASWVRDRLQDSISSEANEVLGFTPHIKVQAYNSQDSNSKQSSAAASPIPSSTQTKKLQLPLEYPHTRSKPAQNWRFSFDEFVVGSCNQLAYAACSSLCRTDFPADSIFLCSDPGLGKTHLLHSMGHYLCQAKQQKTIKVAYLSSEKFANQMVQALKSKEIDKFKNLYRDNFDLLLLEDIHFFQGKEKMQEELLSLIKALQDNGSKVVFTSSFLPKELDKVDSQLTSYFCSGLLAPIQKPDFDLRLRLVQRKAQKFQINIPKNISELVASTIKSDIRQLESCIQNMALKAKLLRESISMDLAKEVLQNYSQDFHTPDLNQITDYICRAFELSLLKLQSKSRKKQVVLARNTAFYLARKYTKLSLKDIGYHFNRRHSTVLKGITNVEKEICKKSSIGTQLLRIVEKIKH